MNHRSQSGDELTPSVHDRIERLCLAFEDAWKGGKAPRIEEFLEGTVGRERSRLLHELVCVELYFRREAGESPSPADYEDRFPEHRSTIEWSFEESRATASSTQPRRQKNPVGGGVAHYEIGECIGRGGMGEVYRAVDARLGRSVAIKLLSEDLASVSARQRFQREAETASSLNHPHIVTVHDVGEHEGRQYLVLEYLDGGNMGDWVRQQKRTWRETVELLVGVADGLASAHSAGILHRDIKPANILISSSGYAKLADFGLAKLVEEGTAPESTARGQREYRTGPGVILGTMAYMSPEQAEGRELDARSDVFSFGVVLHETLAGGLPFPGKNGQEILQNILHAPPQPVPKQLPAVLRFAIEKCLEKEPADRYQSMQELVVDLRRVLRSSSEIRHPESAPSLAPPTGQPRRRSGWLALLGLLAVGLAFLGGALWEASSRSSPPVPMRQRRLTETVGVEEMPAVSPAGRAIAFVARTNGKRQIFVRLLSAGEPTQVTRRDVDHAFPRWIDRDRLIYFIYPTSPNERGSVWEIDFLGTSAPRPILEAADGEAEVDHDRRRIATFRTHGSSAALVLKSLDGAEEEQVVELPVSTAYRSPRWSPDDRQLAFETQHGLHESAILLFDAEREELSTVLKVAGQIRGLAWLPDRAGLVYASSQGSTLPYPPRFALRRVNSDGSDDRLLFGDDAGYSSYVEPDITLDGTLVASRIAISSDVYRYPVDLEATPAERVSQAKRVTRQTGIVQVPSASPKGDEVVYLSDSGGHANLWIASVDGSSPPRKITNESDPSTIIGLPLWSPTGKWITYWKGVAGRSASQWLIRPDGSADEELVEVRGGAVWSFDGEWLYFMPSTNNAAKAGVAKIHVPDGRGGVLPVRDDALAQAISSDGSTLYFYPSEQRVGEIWKVSPVATGEATLLVNGLGPRIPLYPHHYALSPDDRWLATPLRDHGTTNLWCISTEDGSLVRITDFGDRATTIGRQVSWSKDGKYIFAALLETDADIVLLEGLLP